MKALVESLPDAKSSYAITDVTKNVEVQAVVDLTVEKYGRVDVLFNNTGIIPTTPLSEARFDEWREMLDINIMGVLNGIADAVAYAISTPETVAVSEIIIRPTKQVD